MRRGFRISCRRHRLRAVGRGTKKRSGNDDFSLYEGNELHGAPRTDYSPHYRNGSRLLASKGQDKGASSARPVARGIADPRILVGTFEKYGGNKHECEAAQPARYCVACRSDDGGRSLLWKPSSPEGRCKMAGCPGAGER